MKKLKLIAVLVTLLIACTKSEEDGLSGGSPSFKDFDSDLDFMYSCNDTTSDQCTETYYETKPTSPPTCGADFATTLKCVKTSDFLGACKTDALGTNGFRIQTIFFYYKGNVAENSSGGVETLCDSINAKYLPK